MKILLIHQYFLGANEGGGSRFNEMTRLWSEQGHRVTVIAGMVHYTTGKKSPKYRKKFIVRESLSHGRTVYRCHVSQAYNSNFLGRLWAYFSFVFSSALCGVFAVRGKYDVVVVTSPPLFVGITGYILATVKRAKLVFEIRDLWPESAIDTGVLTHPVLIRLAQWLEKWIYRRADLINTLTPAFRRILIDIKEVPAQKVMMIPNAADFSFVENISSDYDRTTFRRQHGLEGKFVIIYVGAHGVANDLMQLVDAAQLLQDTRAFFLCIGEGMEKPKLESEVARRDLHNISFLAAVSKSDVFQYILAADAGTAVLKKCDTFRTVYSNKTFDYMSCRKPILMAIDGASRELIENARCGLFIEPGDAEAFRTQVLKYLQDPRLVAEHGENGYRYAREHFDRRALAARYLDTLQRLHNP